MVIFGKGNWFSAGELIIIEDEVIFGPNSIITSANHTKKDNSYRYGEPELKKIKIGKGTWVAGNCTITAGSLIGNGCLIAANSVVKNEIPENYMYGGVPGKIIKKI